MINLKDKKTIKTLLVLIALLISMLVFPNIVKAAVNGYDTGTSLYGFVDGTNARNPISITAGSLIQDNNTTTHKYSRPNYFANGKDNSTSIFQNNFLFCVQPGARLFEGYNWAPYIKAAEITVKGDGTVTKRVYRYKQVSSGGFTFDYNNKFTNFVTKTGRIDNYETVEDSHTFSLTSNEWLEIQGYLYLLNKSNTSYSPRSATGTITDQVSNSKQISIWAYINKEMSDKTRKWLKIPDQTSTVTINSNSITVVAVTLDGKHKTTYTGGSSALTLYKNAKNIADGTTSLSEYYGIKIVHFHNACYYINSNYGTQQLQINTPPTRKAVNQLHIRIQKYKKGTSSAISSPATFKLIVEQGSKEILKEKINTNSSGQIDKYISTPKTSSDITVTIRELEAPSGYVALDGKVTARYHYNTSSEKWEYVSGSLTKPSSWTTSGTNRDFYFNNSATFRFYDAVEEDESTEIGLILYKRDDTNTTELPNAQFRIRMTYVDSSGTTQTLKDVTTTTDSDGKITIGKFTVSNPEEVTPIKIHIKETNPPPNYNGSVNVTFNVEYDSANNRWKPQSSNPSGSSDLIAFKNGKYIAVNNGYIKVIAKNKKDIPNVGLIISKYNVWKNNAGEEKRTRLDDVKFKITFTQSGTTLRDENGNSASYTLTTNEIIYGGESFNGMIRTPEVIPNNTNKIKVTIQELSHPDGYRDIPSFDIYYKYNSTGKYWSLDESSSNTSYLIGMPGGGYSVKSSGVPYKNANIKIWIKNEPVTNLKINALKKDQKGNVINDEDITFAVTFEQGGEKIFESNAVSLDSTGHLEIPRVRPSKTSDITVIIEELDSGEKYFIDEDKNPITLKFTLNSSRKWVCTNATNTTGSVSVSTSSNLTTVSFNIINLLIPGISINDDATSTDLEEGFTKYVRTRVEHAMPEEGVKFTAYFEQEQAGGTKYSETYNGESGSDGHVVFKDGSGNLAVFQPKNIDHDVTVVVQEVPDERYVTPQSKTYTFKYDKPSNTWVRTDKASQANSYSRTNTTENVTYEVLDEVVNTVKITTLTLDKKDPRNNTTMDGAKFEITFENVAKIDGNDYNGETLTRTVSGNKITFNELEVLYADEDVIATLKEIEAPKDPSGDHYYKPIEGDIVVTLTRQNREYTISDIEVEDQTYLYKESSYEVVDSSGVTDNKVSIVVNNIPLIKIAGQVWQDGQTNEKQVIPPDKHKGGSGDKWLEGVHVYLYDIQGGSLGELVDEDVTDENGHYGVFEDLEQTDEGYQIIFEYNGIWYEGLTIGGDNDAQENSNERSSFNNRFTTITKDQSNDGTQLSYDYDESTETSKLEAENDGTNGATGELDFAIKGYTNSVNKIDLSVDCGLEERFFDLALGTDIQSALVTINGQETTYSYAQIMDLANNTLDVKTENFKNKSSDIGAPIYNLYLYVSDYNYRIEDYVTDATEDNFTNPPGNEDRTEIEHNKNEDDELKVYVTYSVILKDQSANGSAEPGKVNSFVYYYDEKYTPVNLDTTKFTDYPSEHKIVYNGSENLVAPDYRATETITFEVDLNAIDPETVDPSDPEAVQFSNVAEITSYSSAGFIDYDSAPENVEVERNSYGSVSVEAYYEDDTDQANGINIIVAPKKVRTIEGTVFEDINKDGENNDNTPVNDVIVQLIEVKKINGNYYEYIWQETRSGHSEVNVINQDGFTEDSYNNGVTEAGKFEFRNYIPGNYIIRYIYGDGATATYGLTEAVQKYNGEDYKSTKEIGEEYTSIWYNTSTEFGNPTLSKARDNEARRLEAMTYSIAIDTELGATLDAFMNNKTLTAPVGSDQYLSDQQRAAILDYYNANANAAGERNGIRADYDEAVDHMGEAYYFLVANRIAGIFDISAGEDLPEAAALYEDLYDQIMRYVSFKTWMCAETSRINVPVDDETSSNTPDYNDSNEGYATSVANQVIEDKNSVSFGSMNFGLTLRPQTTLELEKHITGLKITPTGVGVQPIVDATADIKQILTDRNIDSDDLTGVKTGLTAMPSLRSDDNDPTRNERGWWKLETDIEELTQGANLEAKYTYAIRNESEKDYLSNGLVEAYKDAVVAGQIQDYIDVLNEKKAETKIRMRNGTYSYKNNATIGQNLGHYYYTGVYKAGVDTPVVAQVERIEESINNDLTFVQQKSVRTNVGDYTSGNYIDAATQEGSVAFAVKGTQVPKQYLNTNGLQTNTTIDTVVETTPSIVFLESVNEPGTVMTDYTDYTQVLAVEKVLSSSGSEGIGTDLPSYMVQVTKYTSATGGRDIRSVPGNLRYIHSEDNGEIAAEMDEFWGERIIISKPTGEDKMQPLQIAVVAISAAAILGVGIVLIRRVVLKK